MQYNKFVSHDDRQKTPSWRFPSPYKSQLLMRRFSAALVNCRVDWLHLHRLIVGTQSCEEIFYKSTLNEVWADIIIKPQS